MTTAMQIITIMAFGAVFFWGGFPTALAFKYHVLTAGLITAAGAETAVLLALFMGKPIQSLVMRKFPAWMEKTRRGKAGMIFQKYGMPGLGLVSPVVPGAPQAVLIGLVLNARPGHILAWGTAGIVLWTCIVTIGLGFGIEFVGEYIKNIQ